MQVLLQSAWDLFQIISFFDFVGLITAVVLALFLLLKYRISGTAWLYVVVAAIVFFFGGSQVFVVDGNISIYWGSIIYII